MEKRFLIDRKYIWLFPVAIVIGSVFTNIAGYDAVSKWDIFSEPVVKSIINADNTFAEIVGYVAPKRIRLFIIVFLISISPFGKRMPYVICSYLGFGMGIILSALAIWTGSGNFCGRDNDRICDELLCTSEISYEDMNLSHKQLCCTGEINGHLYRRISAIYAD